MFELFGGTHDPLPADAARLRRVEAKLDLILQHLGIEHAEGEGDLPVEARALADVGDKLGAIKAYRKATGADLRGAKLAVEDYMAGRR
jgi:ribosomal protein L7/L12